MYTRCPVSVAVVPSQTALLRARLQRFITTQWVGLAGAAEIVPPVVIPVIIFWIIPGNLSVRTDGWGVEMSCLFCSRWRWIYCHVTSVVHPLVCLPDKHNFCYFFPNHWLLLTPNTFLIFIISSLTRIDLRICTREVWCGIIGVCLV